MAKKNSQIWFRKTRGSYLPTSAAGRALYLLYVIYLVALVWAWFAYSRTAWQLIIVVIPLTVAATFVAQLVASKHSK